MVTFVFFARLARNLFTPSVDVGPTTIELTVTAVPAVVSANPRAKAICIVFVTP